MDELKSPQQRIEELEVALRKRDVLVRQARFARSIIYEKICRR
jgi:hypothetical protein